MTQRPCLSITVSSAPNHGGPCPCGHGPWPRTCVQGPKKPTSAHHQDDELHPTSLSMSATVGARLSPPRRHLWTSHHLHNRDIDHLVEEKLGNIFGQRNSLDHTNQPLRHDRDVDNIRRASQHLHCGSATVSSTTAPVELAQPAQQGHRSPCRGRTGEFQWSVEQSRPWEWASAPRQGNRRPSMNCTCGESADYCTAPRNAPSGPYRP